MQLLSWQLHFGSLLFKVLTLLEYDQWYEFSVEWQYFGLFLSRPSYCNTVKLTLFCPTAFCCRSLSYGLYIAYIYCAPPKNLTQIICDIYFCWLKTRYYTYKRAGLSTNISSEFMKTIFTILTCQQKFCCSSSQQLILSVTTLQLLRHQFSAQKHKSTCHTNFYCV